MATHPQVATAGLARRLAAADAVDHMARRGVTSAERLLLVPPDAASLRWWRATQTRSSSATDLTH